MVLGLTAGFIYYSGLDKPIIPAPQKTYPDLLRLRNISLNFSILERKSFDNLKTFGEIPVIPGVTGRENIFAPF